MKVNETVFHVLCARMNFFFDYSLRNIFHIVRMISADRINLNCIKIPNEHKEFLESAVFYSHLVFFFKVNEN